MTQSECLVLSNLSAKHYAPSTEYFFMKLDDFNYNLPGRLIAQEPLRKRDKARLMIIDRRKKTLRHDTFSNISRCLPENSLLVLNNSKVIQARLLGRRQNTGGEVEIFLLKRLLDGYTYEVLMRPKKRLKLGEKVVFNNGQIVATIIGKDNPMVRLNKKNVTRDLEEIGHMPLPPYIRRRDKALDKKYYQTVFAQKPGSVAAPTAGLHFTDRLLSKLKKAGHETAEVTLHINYATFKPVEARDITKHEMHTEEYGVTSAAFARINRAREKARPVVAVGTTSCRVLETIARTQRRSGMTDLFIYPGYKFNMVDALITNFHLPYSTLLMLVYAFGGPALMKNAYREAVRSGYRFFSYGDGMIIL